MASGLLGMGLKDDPNGVTAHTVGQSFTLPNGINVTVRYSEELGREILVDSNNENNTVGYLTQGGTNVVMGTPPNASGTTTPPPATPPAPPADWKMPTFGATYNEQAPRLGTYSGLEQQIQYGLDRQVSHDPFAQRFGRFEYMNPTAPGNNPRPLPIPGPTVPPVQPPVQQLPNTGGGGGGGGGLPNPTPYPNTPPPASGITGTGGYANMTPAQQAQARAEIEAAMAGLANPLAQFNMGQNHPGAATNLIPGNDQKAGLLADPSALTAPTNQSGLLSSFRYSGSAPEQVNYNALAEKSPQAAGAYFNANRNALGGAMGAQGGPSQQAINTFGGGTNYGGPGMGYSGGGMDVYGRFSTGLSEADAAKFGATKNPLSNLYTLPLAQTNADPYGLQGTPIGGLLSKFAPQIMASMYGKGK